jgi:O-antigen ligase
MFVTRKFFRNLLVFFILVSIGFNFVLFNLSSSVYVVHVLLIGTATTTFPILFLSKLQTSKRLKSNTKQILVLFFVLFLLGIRFSQVDFFSEFIKIIFIFASFYMFRTIVENFNISLKTFNAAFVVGFFISVFTMTNFIKLEANSLARLSVDALGNFNAYGFLLGIVFIQALYMLKESTVKMKKLFFLVSMLLFLAALLTTRSRGGTITLLVGLLVFLLLSRKKQTTKTTVFVTFLFLFFFLPILGIYLYKSNMASYFQVLLTRFLDVFSTGGSGRVGLWELLLQAWYQADLVSILIGNGIGSIQIPYNFKIYNSAHNLYLSVLYQLGLIGLISLLLFFFATLHYLLNIPSSNEKALLVAVFAQIVIGSLFDSHYASSQIGWIFGFWFACFLAYRGPALLESPKYISKIRMIQTR